MRQAIVTRTVGPTDVHDSPRLGQRCTVQVYNDLDDIHHTITLRWDRDEQGQRWFVDDFEPWPEGSALRFSSDGNTPH